MINYKNLGKLAGKVAIALLIVSCAYLFGRYQANNDCKTQSIAKELDQQIATLNSFILAGLAVNREVSEMIKVTDQIKEDTHESQIKYIKVVERVPVSSECVIDDDRLRVTKATIADTSSAIASAISNIHATNKADGDK